MGILIYAKVTVEKVSSYGPAFQSRIHSTSALQAFKQQSKSSLMLPMDIRRVWGCRTCTSPCISVTAGSWCGLVLSGCGVCAAAPQSSGRCRTWPRSVPACPGSASSTCLAPGVHPGCLCPCCWHKADTGYHCCKLCEYRLTSSVCDKPVYSVQESRVKVFNVTGR